jgi:RimJ/RimL family protein N-acetyltransferase
VGVLTDDMKRVVLEQRLGVHATVGEDGRPNLSPKGTTTVWDDDHLLFADIRSPQTIRNLEANPSIEVNVVDPFVRKGYRFKGRAEVFSEGDVYTRGLALLRERGYAAYEERVRAIVLIRVERAEPVTSPIYDFPDTSEDAVRASYEARYKELRSSLRPPDPPIRDDEFELRPWRLEDADAVYEACQDAEIQRGIGAMPSPYTLQDAREYLRRADSWWRTGERASFAIVERGDGRILGSVGVGFHGDGRASVGYWVAREARGRGIATRATCLVSRWAIEEQGVERLELHTEPSNNASQRVAEKAGFTREGLLRSHLVGREGRRDSVVFSLLAEELR